jgi:YfiH family protein
MNPLLLTPDWRVPDRVVAGVSERRGGLSMAPYDSFNLALHVGDDPAAVLQNRQRLLQCLPEGMSVQWLEQVHGTAVVDAQFAAPERCADAVYVNQPGLAGAVLTADCLPVFFADRHGRSVAVAHAGWRGLAAGILESTLARFAEAPEDVVAWLGPAIGVCHFEVGMEVRDSFLDACATAAQRELLQAHAFRAAAHPDKCFADLYALARFRLQAAGVREVGGGGMCTHCEVERFYSYRRDGRTGRFVSIVGLAPDQH